MKRMMGSSSWEAHHVDGKGNRGIGEFALTERFVSFQIVAQYEQVIDWPLCQLKASVSD